MKSILQRTCIGCNLKANKNSFIRIVKNKEGKITVDRTGKASGRGAYICDSIECLEKAIKGKKLEKAFEMRIDENVYNDLRGVMLEK